MRSQPAGPAAAVLAARKGLRDGPASAAGSPGAGAKAPVLASAVAIRRSQQTLDNAFRQLATGKINQKGLQDIVTRTMGQLDRTARMDGKRIGEAFSKMAEPRTRAERLYGSAQRYNTSRRASDPGPQPT